MPVYLSLNQDYINFSCKQLCECYINLYRKFGAILSQTNKDIILYPHMYQNVYCNLLQKNISNQERFYISVCNWKNIVIVPLCLVPFERRQIVFSRKV